MKQEKPSSCVQAAPNETQDHAASEPNSPAPIKPLLSILDLERLGENVFRGNSLHQSWQRVYGGQVLGQAIIAAARTAPEGSVVHSLHGYFLLAGDPNHPIVYEVETLRDGRSFSTRRVKVLQHDRAIFIMSASFQKPEPGFEHQATMPDVPPPEDLKSARDLFAAHVDKLPDAMRSYWRQPQPIEMRPVDISRYLAREKRTPAQCIWLKADSTLPDDVTVHQAVLAYASDFTLLDTALIAHGKLMFDTDIQLASLDHSQWFHRPFRADEWILYVQDSPSSSGARGLCRGQLFSQTGTLIASTAQEGLMRPRPSKFVPK